MNIKNLDEVDALNLCQREESHFFDRKAFEVKPANIQKTAVAFANADGGELVIGILDPKQEPDPKKRWRGVSNIEDFNQHIQAIAEITPQPPFRFGFFTCAHYPGYVLQVDVDKSTQIHQAANKRVYVRMSAQSLPLSSQEEIMGLAYSKGARSYEDQVLKDVAIETIVESEPIKTFLSGFSPKTDPLEFVVNQHIVDVATWEPKVSGVLLFAPNPSAVMPKQCAVRIARYETKEDEPERDHLKATYTIEGHLYEQIHLASGKIQEIMSSVSIWTVDGLKNVNYPPEAIWEILVNAIIHRDYSVSDNIHVHIYNNRIEIISPGKLPGNVTIDNILDARSSRNPRIVRALNRYENPPNKDMGEGLNTAFQKMNEWKLKYPEIIEDGNYVKASIFHTPLAAPEETILEFLDKNETIKNSQARELTGIRSENAMKNVFYKLRDKRIIERVPGLEGPASAWRKVKN